MPRIRTVLLLVALLIVIALVAGRYGGRGDPPSSGEPTLALGGRITARAAVQGSSDGLVWTGTVEVAP